MELSPRAIRLIGEHSGILWLLAIGGYVWLCGWLNPSPFLIFNDQRLVAHLAFRWRNVHTVNRQRLVLAALLIVFIPVADEPDAIVTLAIVALAMAALITYEATHFAEARDQIRHQ